MKNNCISQLSNITPAETCEKPVDNMSISEFVCAEKSCDEKNLTLVILI